MQHRQSKLTTPIRLLTLITKLELGGAQQVALHTLRGLNEKRYKKFLISGQGGWLDSEAQQLPNVEVQLWETFKHPIRWVSDLRTFFRLRQFMRENRIDVVHTHSSKAGILGRLAAKAAGVPLIVHTIHGWPFHPHQNPGIRSLYIFLERWAAKYTTLLIAVSRATQEKGEQQAIGKPGQYRIIFPGSDLGAFKPGKSQERMAIRKEFGFEKDAPLVGMVACLKPQKNPLAFVQAAKKILEIIPNTRFLLVGDGQERKAVEAEISRLGINQALVLAGWRDDVPRLMRAFDILALTSLWEGLPCVLAQAMASGIPVVATDVEGTREAVENGKTGLLVPPQDTQAFVQALIQLLQNPKKRRQMGKNALKQADKFQMNTMIKNLDRLYQSAWQNALEKKAQKTI